MVLNSLKQRVFKGAFWTLGGNATSQFLRLGGNLILTRLLFPEAFGLMALVTVFTIGVAMFSDIGINASIVQNKRSDQAFLNTAWTLQVIRGFVVWLLMCLIAWPAAIFYKEPLLMQLLIVSGLSSVILGFQSTKMVVANRKIDLKTVTITEVVSAFIGLIVMTIGAWMTHSVWALVVGGLTQSSIKVFMSFYYFKGLNNSFHWESDAFKTIYRFGRWLMLSSIMTFLAGQVDRLIIGRLFDVKFLGIFSIAIALVSAVYMLSQKLSSTVFFPSYSELARDRPKKLYPVLRNFRLVQIVLIFPIAIALVVWGNEIIDTLYDDRYSDAGWMLEVLSLGMFMGVLRSSYSGVLMAIGRTGFATVLLCTQVSIKLTGILVGYHFWGQLGVIYSLAFTSAIIYPLDVIIYSRFSLWQPEVDLPVVILAIGIFSLYLTGVI